MEVKSTLVVFNESEVPAQRGVTEGQTLKLLVGSGNRPTERIRTALATYKAGTVEHLHWHPIEAYYFVISGHAIVRDIEGREYEVSAGSSIYCPPGIAGAALTYFDKSVTELTVAETAYLAALPKGPNNYHPFRRTEAALERRNWVIDRMVENGFVAKDEGEEAKKQPLGVALRRSGSSLFASDYFAEEVRRQIIEKYGDKALYEGGLSVRTSLDPEMQIAARKALQSALLTYDQRRGFRGPIKQISLEGDWGVPLAEHVLGLCALAAGHAGINQLGHHDVERPVGLEAGQQPIAIVTPRQNAARGQHVLTGQGIFPKCGPMGRVIGITSQ